MTVTRLYSVKRVGKNHKPKNQNPPKAATEEIRLS